MQTWSLPDRRPNGPGPWSDEPDRMQWVDADSGLDCLMLRNHRGVWCGYVGVPRSHPCHGAGYDDVAADVHGGLTFASACQEGTAEEQVGLVCHVPEPGREAHLWWFGFDCAHFMDLCPRTEELVREAMGSLYPEREGFELVYRDAAYVQQQCRHLAAQLAVLDE